MVYNIPHVAETGPVGRTTSALGSAAMKVRVVTRLTSPVVARMWPGSSWSVEAWVLAEYAIRASQGKSGVRPTVIAVLGSSVGCASQTNVATKLSSSNAGENTDRLGGYLPGSALPLLGGLSADGWDGWGGDGARPRREL